METLDIDPDREDETKQGGYQIKITLQGKDRLILHTLLDNNTITPKDQCIPSHALDATQTYIKEDEHFWHFSDELLSNFRQEPSEGIHTLNTRITTLTLINNCKFTHTPTNETLKIMLLAHAVEYHEARDLIRLQDQSTLTYESLLNHFKSLEQCCELFQKVQIKGRAESITLTATSYITSVISRHSNHTPKPKVPQMWKQTPKEYLPCLRQIVLQLQLNWILHCPVHEAQE